MVVFQCSQPTESSVKRTLIILGIIFGLGLAVYSQRASLAAFLLETGTA